MTSRPRIVVVDNHDSYTFNLAALFEVAGAAVRVLSNDDPQVAALRAEELDALVISPGPGTPTDPADVGHLPAVLDGAGPLGGTPVLGVCLGHQLLAHLAGAAIAPIEPHHGHLSTLRHDGTGLFAGLPQEFQVTRYHSLAVLDSPAIRATAWAEDDVIMALEVPDRPWWGVQFHPESVASQYGDRLAAAFLALVDNTGRVRS